MDELKLAVSELARNIADALNLFAGKIKLNPDPVPEPTPDPIPEIGKSPYLDNVTSLPQDVNSSKTPVTIFADLDLSSIDVDTVQLRLKVYDADNPEEAVLDINDKKHNIPLFGVQGVSGNDNKTSAIIYSVPKNIFYQGINKFVFTWTKTAGFKVEGIDFLA